MSIENRAVQQSPEGFVNTTFQQRLALRESQAGIIDPKLLTPGNRAEQYQRLERMIGRTPLLGIEGPNNSTILIKDESQNPTESHYDRVYLATLRKLEEDGVIKPGDELWEVTSGSAGISFAWLANRLGYKAKIFVPARIDQARQQEMKNFGAEVIGVTKPETFTNPVTGETRTVDTAYVPAASEEQTKRFVMLKRQGYDRKPAIETNDYYVRVADSEGKPRVCLVNHSWNHISHKALEPIGAEVSAVIPRGVGIDLFLTILGNGSSTRGAADGLRRRFSRMQVIGVENESNPVWFTQKHPGKFEELFGREPSFEAQEMYGGSAHGTELRLLSLDLLDEVRIVGTQAWKTYMEKYNAGKQPGETIGRSSAASLALAEQIGLQRPGSNILVVRYDKGDRYGDPVTREQDYQTQQPLEWRQDVAVSPFYLPTDLRQAYKPLSDIIKQNLNHLRVA